MGHYGRTARLRGARGFTLTELVVVLAVVSIVASVALPSYQGFITRAKRTQAKSLLLQVADRQEQYFLDNKRYADSLASIGFGDEVIYIDDDGAMVDATSSRRIYKIAFAEAAATAFRAEATPQRSQSGNDTDCGTLFLDNTGRHGHTGTATDCW